MRRSKTQNPVWITVFAALFLMAAAHPALAQTPPTYDVQTCMKNHQTALSKGTQDIAANQAKVWSNLNIPKLDFTCLSNLSTLAFGGLGQLSDPINIIWPLVLAAIKIILQQIINQVCSMVMGAINSAISLAKSLLCIPLPHFGLTFNLGLFGHGSCSGISLIPNLHAITGQNPRTAAPGVWQIWNLNRQ